MAYFKKKKMYEILKSIVDTELDMMKTASYRFYRGSEWLQCESNDKNYCRAYKIYHSGYFISLDIFQYDEQSEEYVEIDRITYQIVKEQLVKTYQRTEVFARITEGRAG